MSKEDLKKVREIELKTGLKYEEIECLWRNEKDFYDDLSLLSLDEILALLKIGYTAIPF